METLLYKKCIQVITSWAIILHTKQKICHGTSSPQIYISFLNLGVSELKFLEHVISHIYGRMEGWNGPSRPLHVRMHEYGYTFQSCNEIISTNHPGIPWKIGCHPGIPEILYNSRIRTATRACYRGSLRTKTALLLFCEVW